MVKTRSMLANEKRKPDSSNRRASGNDGDVEQENLDRMLTAANRPRTRAAVAAARKTLATRNGEPNDRKPAPKRTTRTTRVRSDTELRTEAATRMTRAADTTEAATTTETTNRMVATTETTTGTTLEARNTAAVATTGTATTMPGAASNTATAAMMTRAASSTRGVASTETLTAVAETDPAPSIPNEAITSTSNETRDRVVRNGITCMGCHFVNDASALECARCQRALVASIGSTSSARNGPSIMSRQDNAMRRDGASRDASAASSASSDLRRMAITLSRVASTRPSAGSTAPTRPTVDEVTLQVARSQPARQTVEAGSLGAPDMHSDSQRNPSISEILQLSHIASAAADMHSSISEILQLSHIASAAAARQIVPTVLPWDRPRTECALNYQAPDTLRDRSEGALSALGVETGMCPICLDTVSRETAVRLLNCECRLVYHPSCIKKAIAANPSCPMCRAVIGDPQGKCPSGRMTVQIRKSQKLIQITYQISAGIQRPYHPSPGSSHDSLKYCAWLPYSIDGKRLLHRLKYAWMHGLTFKFEEISLFPGMVTVFLVGSIFRRTSPVGPWGSDPAFFQRSNEALNRLGVPMAEDCVVEGERALAQWRRW